MKLDVHVDNELGETENLLAEMESISKTRFFTLLGGKHLDRFQIHVIIQVQIVEIL